MSIVLKDISKSYNNRLVLDKVSMKVLKGEFHVLLGPSGSGKTTIISIVAGLTRQDRGMVKIGDRDVSTLPPENRNVGFVFQDYALFPHLTVFDNVAYGLRARKLKEETIMKRVCHVLHNIGLEEESGKYPYQLSGGQKQRVALIRALVTQPELLLLDEPMSNLDALTKEKIKKELQDLQHQMGVTTLYVTHNQSEALLLGNRVSVLNQGKIEQVGTPGEIFRHPTTEFMTQFVRAKNIIKTRNLIMDFKIQGK